MKRRIFLAEWRDACALTQEQVSAVIGKSVPTISRWETGERTPGLDDLDALAEIYGCNTGDLFRAPVAARRYREAMEAITILDEMTDADRSAWLQIGKRLGKPNSTALVAV